MATQVPYTGAPQVGGQIPSTPSENINTPLAAFGGAVAAATQHLGDVESGAGNEIFSRAVAMQQLDNDAEAQSGLTKFTQQASQLHSQFMAAGGEDAGPQALERYQTNLENIRQGVGESLSNPAVQRTYNTDSRNFQNRLLFSSAGHSAEALKQYAKQTNLSANQALGDRVATLSTDDGAFEQAKAGAIANADHNSDLDGIGEDDPIREQNRIEAVSTLTARRLDALRETNPFAAQRLFKASIKNGDLRGEDIAKMQQRINSAVINSGSRILSNNITTGQSTTLGDSPVSLSRAADAITYGVEDKSGDPTMTGPTVTSGVYKGQHALGLYQIMQGNLQPWLKEAGMAPMSEDQFLHNAQAQTELFNFKFGQLMDKYGNFNDAASAWFTGHPRSEAGAGVHDSLGTTLPAYLTKANARLATSASVDDKIAAANKDAGDLAGVPFFQQSLENRISSDTRLQNRTAIQQQAQEQNLLDSALTGLDGKPVPTSLDEMMALGPEYKKAISDLPPAKQLELKSKIATAANSDNVITATRSDNYNTLFGMSYTDPDKFMSSSVIGTDLTADDRKELVGLQRQMLRSGGANPDKITTGVLANPDVDALLQASSITKQNRPEYDKFAGQVSQQVQAFQQEHKRAPNQEEQMKIVNTLLARPQVPWFGIEGLPTHEGGQVYEGVPDNFVDKVRTKYPNYTDRQIQQLYFQAQFSELYGKQPKQ